MMHADGLDAHRLSAIAGGPPCIIGHMPSRSSAKTLLAYAHYDVQPEEPVDKWTYPPYGGVVDKGRLWGRGATDNKSGVLAFTKGAKAWLQTRGDLPVNVKFITEGEEEIGSIHLGPFIAANPELVRADAMHCLDGGVRSQLHGAGHRPWAEERALCGARLPAAPTPISTASTRRSCRPQPGNSCVRSTASWMTTGAS